MPEKVSFEEACKISASIYTVDNLRESVPDTIAVARKALADVGWTLQEMCDESRRRMHEKVKAMQGED